MSAPVGIQSDIRYTSDTHEFLWGYKAEELPPHRGQIDQMSRLSQIFLCDLQFSHLLGLFDVVEDRGIGFTRLEVEWPVLRLKDDIVAEVSIETNKL